MGSRTVSVRCHADLARISLSIGDELRNGLYRHRGMDLYGKRVSSNARDRRDVADEIEIELVVEGGVDRVHSNASEKRIAVGGRTYNGLGGDIAGGTRSVLDDELLAEPLRQPFSYQACHDVGATSGGKSDNDAHRSRRIGLRPRDPRYGRQRGSARGQMQEFAAGKFHLNL